MTHGWKITRSHSHTLIRCHFKRWVDSSFIYLYRYAPSSCFFRDIPFLITITIEYQCPLYTIVIHKLESNLALMMSIRPFWLRILSLIIRCCHRSTCTQDIHLCAGFSRLQGHWLSWFNVQDISQIPITRAANDTPFYRVFVERGTWRRDDITAYSCQ